MTDEDSKSEKPKKDLTADEKQLGMASGITRRDYIGGALVGAGSLLLGGWTGQPDQQPLFKLDPNQALDFNGPPGEGDYKYSNGNVWQVVTSAHRVRDGRYLNDDRNTQQTGEHYDLVIVGGGAAGIGGAYYHARAVAEKGRRARCLILDNHPVFGGEAKQNEFSVDGTRLIAPQGSNELYRSANASKDYLYDELLELGVPLKADYQELAGTSKELEFDRTNYQYLWTNDDSNSIGMYFDDPIFSRSQRWVKNVWQGGLLEAGLPPLLRDELLRWRLRLRSTRPPGVERDRWLDSMTYRDFLVKEHKLPVAVADFAEPFLASAVGLGSSAASAYAAVQQLEMPGVDETSAIYKLASMGDMNPRSDGFPGGNTDIYRAFLKHLRPDAISGNSNFGDVVAGTINFDRLDDVKASPRVRLNSTVIDVRHFGYRSKKVRIIYEQGGRLFSVTADHALMAMGGWMIKHIVRDLPEAHRQAYDTFKYSSMVVANVALRNWRFLERLGITACIYTGGEFGFQCNIRRPMIVPGYNPPLNPNKPIVLTFYAPFVYPGETATTQSTRCRSEVFATSYREYEKRIRSQMVKMFSDAGFDPNRDIAGITINRWGHAYVVPEPGFAFGLNGHPAAADIVRKRHGQITFAAAELRGQQNFRGAIYEARRAIEQLYG